ncbi:MAG: hypothetical protein ACRD1R_06360 [Acidobacteriota bacterium]
MNVITCNRRTLSHFLSDRLEIEDKLGFLFHLDHCSKCWDAVYNAVKATHPHYYKTTSRRLKISERELKKLDIEAVEVA